MSALYERLQSFVGASTGAHVAVDPVNLPMIRRWVEAMGDTNPIHVDDAAARDAGRTGVVAPAAMLPVWTMAGYRATVDAPRVAANPNRGVFVALAEAGFTHTPGVNLTHQYARELHIGDRVHAEGTIAAVSEEKQTALGPAHFVDLQSRYHDDDGEPVGEQVLRVIAYDPTTERRAHSAATRDAPARARRRRSRRGAASARDHARSARRDRVHDCVQRLPRRSLRRRHRRAIGMRDIFTDIPTSAGLAARFVTEWAGAERTIARARRRARCAVLRRRHPRAHRHRRRHHAPTDRSR